MRDVRMKMLAVMVAAAIIAPAAMVTAQLGQQEEAQDWERENLAEKLQDGWEGTLQGEVIDLHEYMTEQTYRGPGLGIEREEDFDQPQREDPAQQQDRSQPGAPVQQQQQQDRPQPEELERPEDPAEQPGAEKDPADEPLGIDRPEQEQAQIFALRTERGIVILGQARHDDPLAIEREEEALNDREEDPLREDDPDAEAEVEVDLDNNAEAEADADVDEPLGIERERERGEARLHEHVGQEVTVEGRLYFRDGVSYFVVEEVTDAMEEPFGIEAEEEEPAEPFEEEEDF